MSIDNDKGIWTYFRTHWAHFFPNISDRTNFVRQAANLHVVKKYLQEELASKMGAFTDSLHIVDGLPMPICKFARAHFSKIFRGSAAYGFVPQSKKSTMDFEGIS